LTLAERLAEGKWFRTLRLTDVANLTNLIKVLLHSCLFWRLARTAQALLIGTVLGRQSRQRWLSDVDGVT